MASASQIAEAPASSRRARKKERTRREIFAAAMDLFLARGFDAVTIDDICTVADVARGTFFLHFPTKDALLVAYGHEVTAELVPLLRRHRGGAASALRLALGFLAERAQQHAEMVRLMVRHVMANPGALAESTEHGRDLVQVLAGVVQVGQAAGELRRGVDPTIVAGVVVAAYLAIVNEWTRHSGALDLGRVVKQALDVVLNGIVERRTRSA